MKKLLIILGIFICATTSANAAKPINNYYGYVVYNCSLTQFEKIVESSANLQNAQTFSSNKNAYFVIVNEDEHFFVKFYPANNNTNIYIVSDSEYNKDKNKVTNFLQSKNLIYAKLEDKSAMYEYKNEFIDFARTGALEGLFVLPDYVKPLKTGMGKLNTAINKHTKQSSAIPYKEDWEAIELPLINTKTYNNAEAQVSITENEYRFKNKENKFVHGFEYLVRNEGNSDILFNKVTSQKLAGLKDVTAVTYVDLDRIDLLDSIGSFPPVIIATCGVSLICSVPSWVRTVQITKESKRFARMLPENYNLKPGNTMRILVMKYKDDVQPLYFYATRGDEFFEFSF